MQEKQPRGNPNPSPETRFGAGVSGNPSGKTSQQKQNEYKAAELASKVTLDWMQAISNIIDSANGDEAKIADLRSDTLNLIKEAQSRAHGTPKASVDLTSEDGSMSAPSVIQIVSKDDDS